ncbi:C-C motif chemokine 3-like [Anabas testudineus]|uniref:C-C motif chemokine n=1 Tax=Anabas testudineus TaxID=64144 RepID=A0A3Q1J982_ANATE|nr:C-C motif chemokine 3-like [Anabas testudineus]
MKNNHILLLCILGAALVSSVVCYSGPIPDDCCFEYYPKRLKLNRISSYYKTDNRCAKPAVILVTKRSQRICVDPKASWVQKMMTAVDEKYF